MNFYVKLVPPRASFADDMTPDEMRVMGEHVKYMQGVLEAGKILVYGPVRAKEGAFGMAIFEVESEADVRVVMDADPSVASGTNTYEVSPMRIGGIRGR